MLFINKISSILKHNKDNDYESEKIKKNLFLNFTLFVFSLFILIFSLIHFFFIEKPVSYILFSYFIIFSIIFFLFNKINNYKVFSFISIVLITSLFIFISIAESGLKTGIIWGLAYPVLVSFTFNLKKANCFSLIFFALTLIIFFVPSDFWINYPMDLKIRYIGIYSVIFLFLQFYLRINQQVIADKEKQIIESEQKLREKTELLSKLSYQIRTPLNNIAGIINLKRDVMGDEIAEEVELSVSNLITIINSIPDSFDKNLLQIKGEETLFNINSTIKKSASLFLTEKYNRLKCSLNLSSKLSNNVFGNRLVLLQIIISSIDFLFNNKPENSLKIDLISTKEIDSNSDKTLITIKSNSDYSILKPYLNDQFIVNFENVKIKELIMIKELSSALSGNLEIYYEEAYTSFLFTFMFPDEKVTEQSNSENNILIKGDSFFNKKVKKELKDVTVLLVEDDIMNSKVMTLNLQKHVKKIVIAENGKEALDKYSSTKVDIILMDIRMPLMDGFKTTEKIREVEIGTGFQTPIIAVTANASSEIKKRCFDVGMNDYTTKPTNFKLLLKKMKTQLS